MSDRPDFPKMEEEVLADWKKKDIFKKSLEKPSPKGDFVFFEGPPTANGKPGIHHVEARAYKDVIPRFKTMRGYLVERKAGWDTHGLPVEIEVEKQLGISGKPQIETLKDTPRESIAYFNSLCRKSVWKYLSEWEKLTERIGFWLDLDHAYITYKNDYIESLWWIVKQINERGLLYKDYKVVPYCSRCGTPLSSHELAQGYKEIEESSVYVKFAVKGQEKTYLLAWTTTPWTLPGNVALAVGENINYVKVKVGEEILILAKARLSVLESEYEVLEEMTGKNLVGWEYEPLYKFVELDKKAHYVASANFVSIEDGTGIVHTAVMYGADDFELGQKLDLPKKHLVDLSGNFIPEVTPWAGMFVKDADPKIAEDLLERGLLYKKENTTHTYPFCWRCKTPLIYYAKDSWFVKMSDLRDDLLKTNDEINWVPDYIKEGRFGEWLREVKDWAFTRERYWGTPLPVWLCDSCDNKKVVGSYSDFEKTKSGNTYHILRHGEATQNIELVLSGKVDDQHHLTEAGKTQVYEAARKLKNAGGIDLVVASPFIRTMETAQIIAKELGVPVEIDDDLGEIKVGDFSGKKEEEYHKVFPSALERFKKAPENGETLTDLTRRMHNAIFKLEKRFKDKKILIVSHGDPLWILEASLKGLTKEGIAEFSKENYIKTGELREIELRNLPFDENGFLDPHKPFIDAVEFDCECGGKMTRTPEVIDVWFDSGSMPFAQWHYPHENKERIDDGRSFPAAFISEAIDQTRGWFYTLLAVSTLLKKNAPYKNVICLGHLVDKYEKKMSKSVGNVVDPWEMVNAYGADAVRLFMYTITQPGDTKRFDPQDLDRIVKQNFMILWNVLAFWKMFADPSIIYNLPPAVDSVMDKWVLARLGELTEKITGRLDAYDVTPAGRAIIEFINELSTWYVRRSRDRFKDGSTEPIAVLRYVLLELSKLMAPFTPFFADRLYSELGGEKESVHLEDWTEVKAVDGVLLAEMETLRKVVELGHALRAEHKMRVRQPLSEVVFSGGKKIRPELLEILADELNVKKAVVLEKVEEGGKYVVKSDVVLTVGLNLEITEELKREGWLREIIRHVNSLRKEAGLTTKDTITVYFETPREEIKSLFSGFASEIKKGSIANNILDGKSSIGKDLDLGGEMVWVGIEK